VEVGGLRPGGDGFYLNRVGSDTVGRDDVSTEIDGWYGQVAFPKVGVELVVMKEGEDGGEVLLVVFSVLGEHKNVVEVDDDECVEVGAEDVMHEALESGWGVGEAKGHDGEFKEAIPSPKGSFGYVRICDSDLMVASAKVDFGEDGCPVESVKHVVHTGEGVAVLDARKVEGTVVHAQSEASIFLFDEKDGSPEGRGARSDEAAGDEVSKLAFQLTQFILGEVVNWTVGWTSAGKEVDFVVDGAGWWVWKGLVVGWEDIGELMHKVGEPRWFGGWLCGGGGSGVKVEGVELVLLPYG